MSQMWQMMNEMLVNRLGHLGWQRPEDLNNALLLLDIFMSRKLGPGMIMIASAFDAIPWNNLFSIF